MLYDPSNPANFPTDSLRYRLSRDAENVWKHADDHRGGRGRRAGDLDAHHRHHRHLPPQKQEQETGDGADWEKVSWDSMPFNSDEIRGEEAVMISAGEIEPITITKNRGSQGY